ncbi:flagellar biosynthetic protein FlhB [Bacillus oleivorans]|uniref:Flagellar biosynthetic protein FlhB n=1 Tax=Bacillus oleivorans TaxID=1448271 RepID=A0A285D1K9_9BACI|nr:flagellar biosynthesis protein FlhB [Bacillus oleivorans]SNX73690.1 flagellar biosynthetic protein FlhB [Bacillus oleivorans]
MAYVKLDLQYFAGEKTEKATPKKRQDSRKKGQVAKSQDVGTSFIMLAVFFGLLMLGSYFLDLCLDLYKQSFTDFILVEVTPSNIERIMMDVFMIMVQFLAPVMLAAIVAAIFSNYIQIGFLFTTETIAFKLEKIDPIKGFKRIFSMRAIVELLKSILKITLIGLITFAVLWIHLEDIMMLAQYSVGESMAVVGDLTVQMGLYASFALLALSGLDYLYQKYDFEKNIRMSKQDIKDEYKNIEGDPLIKSKIKQRQREMAMRRMMQEVPHADVVITNPTHYAIALKYDEAKLDAPYVVAKGVDFVAQKIKFIAKENDVTLVENRPLARALYDQADIGQAIPEEFFQAVAEILAVVYQTKGSIPVSYK